MQQEDVLLFDIGNSAMKIAFANQDRVLAAYSLPASLLACAGDIENLIMRICGLSGMELKAVKACIVSSVVPQQEIYLHEAISRQIGCPIFHVPRDLPVPLENRYKNPLELGSDRLIDAWAARTLYPEATSIVIADFGTAITIDCVSGQTFMGGLIFPGPAIASAALARNTAKLPEVDFNTGGGRLEPGRSTAACIQQGLIYGFAALAEGLCKKLKKDLPKPVKVLATGGFARTITRLCPIFDAQLPSLLFEGLRRLYFSERHNKFL